MTTEHRQRTEVKEKRSKISPSDIEWRSEKARRMAESFLDRIGEGNIEAIYLIGSRAASTAREDSDWDFLVVGEGLDDADEEAKRMAEEEDENIEGITFVKPKGINIIFSSIPPRKDHPSLKVWSASEED